MRRVERSQLFWRFVALTIEDAVWTHSVFSKNLVRPTKRDGVVKPFHAAGKMAKKRGLL